MPETAKTPQTVAVLEDRLATTENHLRRAHAIVDRMVVQDTAKADDISTGVLSATSRINEELDSLCGRLDEVAEKVGLL